MLCGDTFCWIGVKLSCWGSFSKSLGPDDREGRLGILLTKVISMRLLRGAVAGMPMRHCLDSFSIFETLVFFLKHSDIYFKIEIED